MAKKQSKKVVPKNEKKSKRGKRSRSTTSRRKIINFVSGNKGKLRELSDIFNEHFKDVEIKQLDIDLPELQGSPEDIVKGKLKLALDKAKKLEGPVLVEDTSLCFNAYGGLPGAYIKYFLKSVKNDGLYKMACAFDDHSAVAQSIYGLQKNKKKNPTYSLVELKGKLFLQGGTITLDGIHASNLRGIRKHMLKWEKKKKIKLAIEEKALKL